MKFATSYEEKIFNEATYFVCVRRVRGTKFRQEIASFDMAPEVGAQFGDKRTMVYAVNQMGSAAHICNV